MEDDTQPAASKATYVQSKNIIYSLEFKEANFLASKQLSLFCISLGKIKPFRLHREMTAKNANWKTNKEEKLV